MMLLVHVDVAPSHHRTFGYEMSYGDPVCETDRKRRGRPHTRGSTRRERRCLCGRQRARKSVRFHVHHDEVLAVTDRAGVHRLSVRRAKSTVPELGFDLIGPKRGRLVSVCSMRLKRLRILP